MCILQLPETNAHLFLRCNFAKASWNSIGVTFTSSRTILQILERIKEDLALLFFMEIIILLAWSIWHTRNNWIFNSLDPSVQCCRRTFKKEFFLLLHKAKPSLLPAMEAWILDFQPYFSPLAPDFFCFSLHFVLFFCPFLSLFFLSLHL
jgi:hypothetical protein